MHVNTVVMEGISEQKMTYSVVNGQGLVDMRADPIIKTRLCAWDE
jgi:hypothetical protein